MRAIRAASTALLGAAALALAAPAALAADGVPAPGARAPGAKAPGDFLVSPAVVAPGGRVTLSAPGCASTARASAGIFDTATIAPGASVTATVDADAKRGAVYTVLFNCTGGVQDTVALTISGAPSATPTISATILTPPRGVQGGLGGSMAPSTTEVAVGGVLAVTAVSGAAFYAIRRRAGAGRRH
ncbi:hypothetical protein PUR59_16880 [Streptomyces sp. SP18ES09]|uniref:hypothetical protein n=1 Tax=Streptomyces sp. SP18ES09 TaxID=3002532 RepID=UPI002E76CE32|nr:hypothetical protein [Streptomyces sp. SP18ES09]MEE1816683.1 hypothetical protein [Streptomyces sp. SP18ES09]